LLYQFLKRPELIRNTSRHGGRDPKRLMKPDERCSINVGEPDGSNRQIRTLPNIAKLPTLLGKG